MVARTMKDELEALRRELSSVPIMEDDGSAAAPSQASGATDLRSEIDRVVRELQAQLDEAVDDAGQLVSEHPVASLAAAFLLGVAAGSLLMRIRTR